MNRQIDIIKKVRTYLLDGLNDLTTEQFNKIPAGYNNNIIWNLGHLVATQQSLCYKRAGLPILVDDEFWESFRSGSKPEKTFEDAEIAHIKQLFLSTMDQFETDYNDQIFSGYTALTTRSGVEMSNINEALDFLPFHEGLHSGVIGTMRKLV